MKKIILTAAAGFAVISGSALAADLPAAAPPMSYKAPAMAPVYNWTGIYVDAGFGYGM
jgi:outer membrane immunogenic protein